MSKEPLNDFHYALIAIEINPDAYEKVSVLHLCAYINPPTENDKFSLEEELNTDPEFNLVGRINKDVFVVDCPPEIFKEFLENDL